MNTTHTNAKISVIDGREYEVVVVTGPSDVDIRSNSLMVPVTFEFKNDDDMKAFEADRKSNPGIGVKMNGRGKAI